MIKVGKLSLTLDESEAINLSNAVPTPTPTALKGTPYHFKVTNNGTVVANYSIHLDTTGNLNSYIIFALKRDGKIISMDYIDRVDYLMLGNLNPNETAEYDLYLWIDYNASSADFPTDSSFDGTIRIAAIQPREQKLIAYMRHVCDGVTDCLRTDSNATYFQQEYYLQYKEKYIWYSGKLWIVTSYDNDGNMKAITNQSQVRIPWGTTVDYQGSYVESWLKEEFLPTLHNYQKFLVTDYVWNYSSPSSTGKQLGSDKLVTAPVGLLNTWDIWQSADDNDGYNTSDGMLQRNIGGNAYYLGTSSSGSLYNNGLSRYVVGVSAPMGVTPAVVFRKDVIVVSGTGTETDPYRLKGDASGKNGDLLNTRYSGEYIAFGDEVNYLYQISNVENGLTKINPAYSLVIKQVTSTEETFSPLLGYARSLSSPAFYQMSYSINDVDATGYDPSSTNYPLAYFLNHDFLTTSNGYLTASDRSMMMDNQTWYLGTMSYSDPYQNAKKNAKQVMATVGLPRFDERVPDLERDSFISIPANNYFTLTNNGTELYTMGISVRRLTTSAHVIPSLYLKSTVKIKGGSGTKTDPYILMLG